MPEFSIYGADVESSLQPTLSVRGDNETIYDLPLGGVMPGLFEQVLPWRTFRWHYGQRHYSGSYWAATTSTHVIYESRLELARLLLADFDRSVKHIVAQPFMLRSQVDDSVRRHIPDYLLLTDDGPVVVDVKPARLLDAPDVVKAFDWVRAVVESLGWSFDVASEPPPILMENVRFLAGFRRRDRISEPTLSDLCGQNLDGVSVSEALHATQNAEPSVRAALFHLLWNQELHTDLSVILSSKSMLQESSSP